MELPEELAESLSTEKSKRASRIENDRSKGQEIDRPFPKSNERVEICNEQRCNESTFYSPLQDTDEIRLLYLHLVSSDEQIRCTVTNAKYFERPSYEALSYVWGSVSILKSILVNGADFTIRENLWLVLQHLRLESETRVLWIDAICINQYNVDERNHQVTQMGRIYSQATRVVVWLGAPDASSRIAFEVLLSANWTEFIAPSNDTDKADKGDHQLEAFLSLLTRGYWQRLWIIQEFFMTKHILIQSGDDKCTGFRVSWFLSALTGTSKKSSGQFKRRKDTLDLIFDTFSVRLFRQRDPPNRTLSPLRMKPASRPLLELFMDYKAAECQDQRDKILGLHSLAEACCKDAIPVNYSSTWSLILQRLIRHQILHHHSVPDCVSLLDSEFRVQRFQRFYRDVEERLPRSYLADMRPASNIELARREPKNIPTFDDIFLRWAENKIGPYSLKAAPILYCYTRGRICYKSPQLSTDFSKQRPPMPELGMMIKLQIKFLCSLGSHDRVSHPHATTEIDLVGDLPVLVETQYPVHYNGDPTKVLTSPSRQQPPIDYWGCNSWSDYESDITEDFIQLLFAAQQACSKSSCVLAFEENGLVLFAPKDINMGDIVCQFPGSDILTVAELSESNITGRNIKIQKMRRAINFLASKSSMAVDICGKPMSFKGAKSYSFWFNAERNFIRELCWMSNTPNGEHNIPIEGEIERIGEM